MNKKNLLYVIAILVVGVLFWQFTKPAPSSTPSNNIYTLSGSTVSDDKKISLIAYEDFQCPYCGNMYPVLEQIKETYKDKIVFQFRHFPLEQAHPNARAASKAAQAAALQGKFWEMHNKLYENQSTWSVSTDPVAVFNGYAKDLGLDLPKFEADYASTAVNSTINADIKEGQTLKITGTPTFVIEGKVVSAGEFGTTLESAGKAIDAAYNAKFPSSN